MCVCVRVFTLAETRPRAQLPPPPYIVLALRAEAFSAQKHKQSMNQLQFINKTTNTEKTS